MNVSQFCHVCKQQSDQMLMLSCIHDTCTNCAASNYAEQVHIKGLNPQIYICEICQDETKLDSSSVSQLNSLSKSFVRMPTSIRNSHVATTKNNKSFGASKSPQSTQVRSKKQSHSPNKKISYFCKQHSEEQISYYCFTCHETICPQCAIHGGHKDHQVKLIKKAISEVKSDYLQIMNNISTSQNSMSKYKDNFLKNIKECNERHNIEKSIVERQFDLLRNSLAVKEKQIIRKLSQINKQNVKILTSFLEDINLNYEQICKIKKSVELVLRKDQVLILQDYKGISNFEEKVEFIKKQCDQISGEISLLNHQHLQQETLALNQNITKIKQNFKKEHISSSGYHHNSNSRLSSKHKQNGG